MYVFYHSLSIFTFVCLICVMPSKIPDTPIWLLAQHRDKEAAKSLRWLRGWVAESEIAKELNELKNYREFANSCAQCQSLKARCTHPAPTMADKLKALFQASYAKPMIIITVGNCLTNFIGAHSLNPYLVQILNTYETPMSPVNSTVCADIAFWSRAIVLLM